MKYNNHFLTVCLLTAVLLSGCGGQSSRTAAEGKAGGAGAGSTDDRLQVVTTLFPYYDFIHQIAGEKVCLKLVVPAGMDSHSFEPTPADMLTIQNADVLICNGGEMEHWLEEVLESMDTSDMRVEEMMDVVNVVEEEHVEGMETEEGHDHEHEDIPEKSDDHDGFEMHIEYDEHIWTSPVNAMKISGHIAEILKEEDPEHQDIYKENAASYIEELNQLHNQLLDVMKDRKRDMIIVADKFPFRYLADEYGLNYRAAFTGCSGDTEPSAKTIAYLIDKIKSEKIPVIYYLELSSHRTAEVISEETGAEPLLLHSCHNVTRREFEDGVTYLQLMENNVETLRKGLHE